MVSVEEPVSDFTELGPVIYQESKLMDNEINLICVHDNAQKKFVNFEVYSFESGKVTRIQWDYMNFDSHFRFNAELMNPNNKEGRYHWVCERLEYISDGKGGRKLNLGEVTDDVPQIADKSTPAFKIPTGRMNYGDRQRLRMEMERLPKNRASNIERLEAEFKERFIRELGDAKELDNQRTGMRMQRIHAEREKRYDDIINKRKKENMILVDYSDKEKMRELRISNKMGERKAKDDDIINVMMDRHAAEAAVVQDKVDVVRAEKKKERVEITETAREKYNTEEQAESNRLEAWEKRDERIETKTVRLKADLQGLKDNRERVMSKGMEKKLSQAHEQNLQRQALWEEQRVKQEQRGQDEALSHDLIFQAEKAKRAQAEARELKRKSKARKKEQRAEDAGAAKEMVPQMDEDGTAVYDADGNPVLVPAESDEPENKMDAVERTMRERQEREEHQAELDGRRKAHDDEVMEVKSRYEVERVEKWKGDKDTEKEREETRRVEMLEARAIKKKALATEADAIGTANHRKEAKREKELERKAEARMKKLIPQYKKVDRGY